jgi:hypothetical protein
LRINVSTSILDDLQFCVYDGLSTEYGGFACQGNVRLRLVALYEKYMPSIFDPLPPLMNAAA